MAYLHTSSLSSSFSFCLCQHEEGGAEGHSPAPHASAAHACPQTRIASGRAEHHHHAGCPCSRLDIHLNQIQGSLPNGLAEFQRGHSRNGSPLQRQNQYKSYAGACSNQSVAHIDGSQPASDAIGWATDARESQMHAQWQCGWSSDGNQSRRALAGQTE